MGEIIWELERATYSSSELQRMNAWTLQEKVTSSTMKFWRYNLLQAHVYIGKRKKLSVEDYITCKQKSLHWETRVHMFTIYFLESKSNFGILSIAEDASDKPY